MFSFIFVFILLLPMLRPCEEGSSYANTAMESGTEEEHKHACCSFPVDDNPSAPEEDPCAEACVHYCCSQVIGPINIEQPAFSLPETDRRAQGETNMHTHEFTHLIWHPPQAA